MKSTAPLAICACFALLAVAFGPVAIAHGQFNELGYEGGYTGTLTRDLLLGPEWRAYQTLAQPAERPLESPIAARRTAPAPLPAPASAVPLTKQTDYALRFFGGESARQTLQQMPQRPAMVSSTPAPVAARGQKPFQHASRGTTISPYLNLDRLESSEDLPNYFTFVRPQQEQMDINRRQQRELAQLNRKVQMTAYSAGVSTRPSPPTTGHGTRFGDTGRYYGGWRR